MIKLGGLSFHAWGLPEFIAPLDNERSKAL
jgi:hypothetical protein